MKTLLCWLVLVSSCYAVDFQLSVDDVNQNLPFFPQTAVVTYKIAPYSGGPSTTWNIGTLTQADFGQFKPWIRINESGSGLDWTAANEYLVNATYDNPAALTLTVDAGPLKAQRVWEFPHYESSSYKPGMLLELRFRPSAFVTAETGGYIAGTFGLGITIPEPNPFLIVLTGILMIALAVLRRREI